MKMDSDINYIIHKSLKGDKIYQEILLKKLNPLIFNNIYKYYKASNPLVEDLLHEGYIIILQSLKDYDAKRNVHFLQYVKIRLFYFYKNYYKKSFKQGTLSVEYLNETGKEFKSDSPAQISTVILKEQKAALYKCMNELSEKEQRVLNLFYFKGFSIQEISEELNLEYRSVINIKSKAVKKLRSKCYLLME
jgi:RNA polymerase sporulation-specific sigma factor